MQLAPKAVTGWIAASAVAAALLAGGCGDEPGASSSTTAPPAPATVKLVVAVVDDEQLADGLELQRGAWQAATGGDFTVERSSSVQLAGPTPPTADLIVFPSRALGALVERGALQPVRDAVLAKPELALADVFPVVRSEMQYGGATYALPLGAPPLLAAYAVEALPPGGEAPRTLAEYLALGADVARPPGAFAVPLAETAAAHALLVRALTYVEPNERPAALFDADTMAPRIGEPAFIRAMGEMVVELGAMEQNQPLDFAAAVAHTAEGAARVGWGWPGAAGGDLPEDAGAVRFAPPPVADESYDRTTERWQKQTLPEPVAYVGAAGRLLAVSRRTRNAVTAFQLAAWLSASERIAALSGRSGATLWFRRSQQAGRRAWTDGRAALGDDDASAAAVAAALSADAPFLVPRIPEIDRYLAALADAVRDAVAGRQEPQAALDGCRKRLDEITDQCGRDAQRRAYRRHLGLEP